MIRNLAVCACVVVTASAFAQSTGKKTGTSGISTTSTQTRTTDSSSRVVNGKADAPRTVQVSFPGAAPGPKVLFYRDSAGSGACSMTSALTELGLSHTFTSSPTDFASQLASTNWDIVISANQGSTNAGTFQTALKDFTLSHPSARVIIIDWTPTSASTYFPALGFGWAEPKNYTSSTGVTPGPFAGLSIGLQHVWGICSTYTVTGGSRALTRNADGGAGIMTNASGNVVVSGYLANTFTDTAMGKQIARGLIQGGPFTLEVHKAPVACTLPGTEVTMDVKISNLPGGAVSGYFGLRWDPAVMQLVSITPGDAPWTTIPLLSSVAGQATVLCSIPATATPSQADAVVAKLRYRTMLATCDGSRTDIQLYSPVLGIAFTDGNGSKMVPSRLVDSAKFVVDDTAPVFTGVQTRVDSLSCAGRPCGADSVGIVPPTAADGCAPVGSVPVNASRSDGKAMTAAWPCGTTRVTWTAADLCGNTAVAYTDVVVSTKTPASITLAHVGASSYAAAWDRCVTLKFTGLNGASPVTSTVKSVTNFNGMGRGTASIEVEGYVPGYTCLLVEDGQHSLKSRVPLSIDDCTWSGDAQLVLGNITGPGNVRDDVIDVLDWGAYVVRHGLPVGSRACDATNVHADLDGNNVVDAADGNIILTNFGRTSDPACAGSTLMIQKPILSIRVRDLARMGMAELIEADLNGDGFLDRRDMDLAAEFAQN